MTSNYPELNEIVRKKFKNMSYFSVHVRGNWQSLNTISTLEDTEENRFVVEQLILDAHRIDFDIDLVEVSDEELKAIRARVWELQRKHSLAHQALCKKLGLGRNDLYNLYTSKRKNERYKRIITALNLNKNEKH